MKRAFLLIPLILFIGCKRNESFTVNGHIKNNQNTYVYISRVGVNTVNRIDSSKIVRKGSFGFRIKAKGPDFFQIGTSATDFITLLAEPGEKIKLEFYGSTISNNYSVTGSKESELIQILDYKLIKTKAKLDSLSSVYDRASKEPDFETKRPLLEKEYLDIIKEQRKFNIGFILQNIKSLVTIKALYQRLNDQTYVLYDPKDLQYLKIASDSLKRYYPESKHTKALISDFEKELNQLYANQLKQISQEAPEVKLDPNLKDLSGKRIALSSLKGKYVLLCFWSTDSRDCIVENLQLKEYYKMYHRKGFEIYQINLDKDESVWRNEVRFDDLPWINTREDNPDNQINARLFNVKSLPANYLFDPKGDLITIDLHDKNLQLKLNQLFGK